MPKIIITNLNEKSIDINDNKFTVLKNFQNNYIDWMHSCGGKGRCTTCKMYVNAGIENLSTKTTFEIKMEQVGLLREFERLACQCSLISGELRITVPESCKLPHVKYSD